MVSRVSSIELILEDLKYPESPCWSERDNCLYFVEWEADRVCAMREGKIGQVLQTIKGAGPSAVIQDKDGYLWVCLYSSGQVIQLNRQGNVLKSFNRCQGQPFRGPNDLVADDKGGVYFTDSGNYNEDWIKGKPQGAIYYLDSSDNMIRLDAGLCYPNGIALSPDRKKLYVNEHRKNRTLRYTIQEDASLSPASVFYTLDDENLFEDGLAYELGPDGMEFDWQGCLWVAHYGGGKIITLSAEGELLGKTFLPKGRRPTNVDFDPAKGIMYATEAELGLLYRIRLAVEETPDR
jgi:gluconolactonase